MIRTVITAFFAALAAAAFAQGTPQFTHQIVSTKATQLPARDFWFTLPQNYENQGGKYYEVYATSKQATTINIQVIGGAVSKRTIKPLEAWAFKIPLGWEVTTSGIIEDLGIHVWSDNADLNVNLLSFNPNTSDGMNIIPTSGWGTEYVVAAYAALYEGFGSNAYDYPSEFSVVASEDNTKVTIKPSADIRRNGLPNDVLHPANDTFSVILNRGQCIQFMTTLAQNVIDFDVTGTHIISTKPIGVFGASQCANIPPEYPYCDHILEMIQPVNAWGKIYHTAPFYMRKGGDSFLMIASQDGQTIYFNGAPITSLNKYEWLFRPYNPDAGAWTSNAPFLLAQYINSTTWPDPITGQDNSGVGDPAMVVINPQEQYSKDVIFQTPMITTGTGFTHYANILVNKDATTTLDSVPINSYPSTSFIPIPFSDYFAYRVRSLKSGTHRVVSDSAVGVYVYGYSSYNSYAWNGALGVGRISTSDTIAPNVTVSGDCYCASIAIKEAQPGKTGIASIVVESNHNIRFTLDPAFRPGLDSTFYDICIIKPADTGFIRVLIYDSAGNKTTVTSRIDSRKAPRATPSLLSIAYAGVSIPNYRQVTITNKTGATLPLAGAGGLRFAKGDQGFDLVSPDLSDLPTDSSRSFLVRYVAADQSRRADTLIVGGECNLTRIPVESYNSGGVAALAGFDAGCILVGTQKRDSAIVTNAALYELTLESITIDDPVHFKLAPISLPLVIQPGERLTIPVIYEATDVDTNSTTLRLRTKELGDLTAILTGCALPQGSVRNEPSQNEDELRAALRSGRDFAWLTPVPNPSERSSTVRFRFGLAKPATVALELFDLNGKWMQAVPSNMYSAGTQEILLDNSPIPAGTYVYRYIVHGIVHAGMLTIQ